VHNNLGGRSGHPVASLRWIQSGRTGRNFGSDGQRWGL